MSLHVSDAGRHIALVTIDNQQKRNAMPRATLAELAALWDRLEEEADCRCIVITGAGDKAFCAGADIGGDLTASEETARIINRGLLKTTQFSKPIVAAVNGDCAGGGVELLLSTDIRIAAEHARFGLPEVRWSIYPFGGATAKIRASRHRRSTWNSLAKPMPPKVCTARSVARQAASEAMSLAVFASLPNGRP